MGLLTDPDHDGNIEIDVVLVWTEKPRIITGADILGRLLKGTHASEHAPSNSNPEGVKANTQVDYM